MIRFATKQELWAAMAASADVMPKDRPIDLKSFEDVLCLQRLYERRGLVIGEIGGGHSRVLPRLADQNSCVNIEDFSGAGHGPKEPDTVRGVRNAFAKVGDFSAVLESGSFDVLFSISVVEHIADADLPDFFKDIHRLLKPGGLLLNFIDVYLGDQFQDNGGSARRIALYRQGLADGFSPVGAEDLPDPLSFRTDMLSNPDSAMYLWNKIGKPQSVEVRARMQCCALVTEHYRK